MLKEVSWATIVATLLILILLGMLVPKLRGKITGAGR